MSEHVRWTVLSYAVGKAITLVATVARARLLVPADFGMVMLAFVAQQNADYLAIGSALGSVPLGLFSMAYRFSELPYLAVADPVTKVTFPTFSAMRARGEDVSDHYWPPCVWSPW